MSKICGWDIGIKNCSYCIIESIDDDKITDNINYIEINGSKYTIKLWDVINILPDIEKKQITSGNISLDALPKLKCTKVLTQLVLSLNNKEEEVYCDKPAIFCSRDIPLNTDMKNNLSEYNYISYCNKHFKETVKTNKSEYIYLNDKSLKCCYIKDDNKCNSNKIMWIDKKHYFLTYCDKHYKEICKTDNIGLDNFIKIIKNKNVAQLDLTLLGDALFTNFDKKPELCNVDTILLENQPVLKNPTMKSIQMFLFSYFIIKGIKVESSPCNKIKCYSANQKLELHKIVNDDETITLILESLKKIKNQYARNKKLAILLVEYILTKCGNNTNNLLNFFREHKKKDDLADSFLMTLHFLESDKLKKLQNNDKIKTLIKPLKEKKKLINTDNNI